MRLYEFSLDQDDAEEYNTGDQHKEIHKANKLPKSGAITDYTDDSSSVNSHLHNEYYSKDQFGHAKQTQQKIKKLDKVLAKSRIKQEVTVYSGLRESPQRAYKLYGVPYDQPIRLILPAYTSTSTKFKTACGFAQAGKFSTRLNRPMNYEGKDKTYDWARNLIRVTLPTGTAAGSAMSQSSHEHENEFILHRRTIILVQPNPVMVDSYGETILVWSATIENQ